MTNPTEPDPSLTPDPGVAAEQLDADILATEAQIASLKDAPDKSVLDDVLEHYGRLMIDRGITDPDFIHDRLQWLAVGGEEPKLPISVKQAEDRLVALVQAGKDPEDDEEAYTKLYTTIQSQHPDRDEFNRVWSAQLARIKAATPPSPAPVPSVVARGAVARKQTHLRTAPAVTPASVTPRTPTTTPISTPTVVPIHPNVSGGSGDRAIDPRQVERRKRVLDAELRELADLEAPYNTPASGRRLVYVKPDGTLASPSEVNRYIATMSQVKPPSHNAGTSKQHAEWQRARQALIPAKPMPYIEYLRKKVIHTIDEILDTDPEYADEDAKNQFISDQHEHLLDMVAEQRLIVEKMDEISRDEAFRLLSNADVLSGTRNKDERERSIEMIRRSPKGDVYAQILQELIRFMGKDTVLGRAESMVNEALLILKRHGINDVTAHTRSMSWALLAIAHEHELMSSINSELAKRRGLADPVTESSRAAQLVDIQVGHELLEYWQTHKFRDLPDYKGHRRYWTSLEHYINANLANGRDLSTSALSIMGSVLRSGVELPKTKLRERVNERTQKLHRIARTTGSWIMDFMGEHGHIASRISKREWDRLNRLEPRDGISVPVVPNAIDRRIRRRSALSTEENERLNRLAELLNETP